MREEVSRGGARARRVDASRETGSRRSLGDVRDDGEENVVDVVSKRVARRGWGAREDVRGGDGDAVSRRGRRERLRVAERDGGARARGRGGAHGTGGRVDESTEERVVERGHARGRGWERETVLEDWARDRGGETRGRRVDCNCRF